MLTIAYKYRLFDRDIYHYCEFNKALQQQDMSLGIVGKNLQCSPFNALKSVD
jgi:hypothetical protein